MMQSKVIIVPFSLRTLFGDALLDNGQPKEIKNRKIKKEMKRKDVR